LFGHLETPFLFQMDMTTFYLLLGKFRVHKWWPSGSNRPDREVRSTSFAIFGSSQGQVWLQS